MGWWCCFGGWVLLEVISNLHSSDSMILIGMVVLGWQLEGISNLHSSDSGVLSGMVVLLWWLGSTGGHSQPSQL